MKKLLSLVLALAVLLGLAACSSGGAIRYDLSAPITNLDPQFTTDPSARLVISQVFEGLFRLGPEGEVLPALAQEYTVSQDGLTYTFHLRQDAQWSGNGVRVSSGGWEAGEPVTAHDFVFALRRMFDPTAPSPFAGEFRRVANAQRILAGELDPQSLGVAALDDNTLQIRLDQPDSLLLQRLAASYAMPCCQAFFRSTTARYGLALENLIFNGPFYLRSWTESLLSLRQNSVYTSPDPPQAFGVDFYIAQGDAGERFLAGRTDAAQLGFSAAQAAQQAGVSVTSFEGTTWVLLLNHRWNLGSQEEPLYPFTEADIRLAIAHTVDRSQFSPVLPANLRPAATLVPPAVFYLGWPYRTLAGDRSPVVTSWELAKRYQVTGLEDLGLERLPTLTLLVPEEWNLPQAAGYLQQGITQALSVYCGLEVVDRQELEDRVAAGDYQLAVYPLSGDYPSPQAFFSYFLSGGGSNYQGCADPEFDALVDEAYAYSGRELLAAWQRAEEYLLAQGLAIPLCFETSYYAAAQGVGGIQFSPFLSAFSFRDGRKE